MTNQEKILRDLSISQSTADSIAGRLGLHIDATEIILKQLLHKQLITSHQLTKPLTVYRLTAGIPTLTTSPTP
jgi:predicted ArsR family transcriptional regulator